MFCFKILKLLLNCYRIFAIKTVDLYDQQMRKIKREELLQPEQKPVKSLKQRELQKEDAPAKKQSRKAKVHV
jgi:hypothetical protein